MVQANPGPALLGLFLSGLIGQVGLVSRIVPPSEANALAQQQARKLATKPMSSLLQTKRFLKMGQADAVAQRLADEAVVFGRMLGEPAAREAFAAFMAKRLPDFSKM